MRALLVLSFFFVGCAHGPVKRVDWFNFKDYPKKNTTLICTYIYDDLRLLCAMPEDYLLVQQSDCQSLACTLEPGRNK